MSSQRALCHRKLPYRVLREKKTKKEMLYNDIIAVLEKYGMTWKSSEVDGCGGVGGGGVVWWWVGWCGGDACGT